MAAQSDITEMLRRYSRGDQSIAEAVLREVLPRLHKIAVRELRKERCVAPLDPTELINEVWLRSLSKGGWQIASREHFYAIAGSAMRCVLVDFARSRLAQRRGLGDIPFSIDDLGAGEVPATASLESTLRLGELMERMTTANPDWARVVDLHYFVGFTLEETADALSLSMRQVRHRWEKGRDWLKLHL